MIGARLLPATAPVLAMIALVSICGPGCLSADSGFGRHCAASSECADGDLCVDDRCVPARRAGDVGESCAAPLPLVPGDGAPVLASGAAALAGAQADYEARCAGGADVVFSFSLDRPAGLRVRADSDVAVALSLHPLADGVCDVARPDDCAVGSELLVARAEAGSYALIVHGEGTGDDVVRVTVERLDCPLGYLPYGDGRCAGFREVAQNGIPRSGAKVSTLPDGRGILTGGLEADGVPASNGEIFELASETWSYVAFRERRQSHSPVLLGEHFLVLGGGLPPELLDSTPGHGDVVTDLDYAGGVAIAGSIDEDSSEIAVGLASGVLLLVVDDSSWLMKVKTLPILCQNNLGCLGYGAAVCVNQLDTFGRPLPDGFCLCEYGTCVGPPVLVDLPSAGGDAPLGAASAGNPLVATTRDEAEVVLLHNGDAVHELDVGSRFWRRIDVSDRQAVALDSIPNGAIVSGGREGGRASSMVERIDSATRAAHVLTGLREARIDHAHAVLPDGRILIAGGSGNGGALPTAELIDPAEGDTPLLPRLPVPLAHAVATTLGDGRVLIVGAEGEDPLMRRAFVFEVVAPDFAPPVPDADALCGAVVPLPEPIATNEETAEMTYETTVGERDRFRDTSCGSVPETIGPERIFSFELAEPRSFHARTDQTYTSLALWSGECQEHSSLGCVTTGETAAPLEAPTLDAGRYMLVVEAHEGYGDATGMQFGLRVWTGEPSQCPAGDEDPLDDTADGARTLDVSGPSIFPEVAPSEAQTGKLCRGDVDHLIINLWSEQSELMLDNAAQSHTTLAPALFDDAASLAAGEPVFHFGEPMPFGRGSAPPGIYLLRMTLADDDPLLHHWRVRHYPVNCVPDDVDSLAAVLDDGQNPVRRTELPTGELLERCLTSPVDVDVAIVEVPPDIDTSIVLEDGSDAIAELFTLEAPDAPLGAPIGTPFIVGTSMGIPAGVSPWVAVRVTSARLIGETYSLGCLRAEPGDTCFNALPFADSGTLSYQGAIYSNDLSPEILGDCTGYAAFGDDLVGTVTLADGDRISASLAPVDDADASLYLLTSCESVASSCAVGADEAGSSGTEYITWQHSGPAQSYFLVGDSYYPESYSAVLSWIVTRAGQ